MLSERAHDLVFRSDHSIVVSHHDTGIRGFAAGLTPRLLTIVPGNAIAWITYEKVKQLLG